MTFHTFISTYLKPSQLNTNFDFSFNSTMILNTLNIDRSNQIQMFDYPNLVFDSLRDELKAETKTNLTYESTLDFYSSSSATAVYESVTFPRDVTVEKGSFFVEYDLLSILDLFDDASIDANIWSTAIVGTGTVTETGGNLVLFGDTNSDSATAISDQVNGVDFFQKDTIIYTNWSSSNFGASGNRDIGITDGTIFINIISGISFNVSSTDGYIFVDKSGRARYNNGAWIDITSLSTNWYLFARVYNGAGVDDDVDLKLNFTYITDAKTSTVALQISADNGSNYTTMTKDTLTAIANTGTNVKMKVSFTQANSEIFMLRGLGFMHNK